MARTESATKINNKVSKAMNLLKEAGTEQVEHTKSQMTDKYDKTKDQFLEAKDQATATIDAKTKELEAQVQKNPFYFLAGFAFVGVILGFLLGRKN